MKRITEEGYALKRELYGRVELCRPLYRSRDEARIALKCVSSPFKYWVVKVRVSEITPKLKKKIKISLATGARRAK